MPWRPRKPLKHRRQSRVYQRILLLPSATRVVFATTSRVVLRPGPGAPEETAPSAEPSFAEHTRGTVPLVAQRVVTEHSSGEPPAPSPSRTSVTVTPLVDPTHRTPNRNWADQSLDDDLDDEPTDSGAAPSGASRSRTPPPKPLVVKPPPQCIREDPSQRKPQYVESGRVEEFLPSRILHNTSARASKASTTATTGSGTKT